MINISFPFFKKEFLNNPLPNDLLFFQADDLFHAHSTEAKKHVCISPPSFSLNNSPYIPPLKSKIFLYH